jgi:hypothetical protein
MGFEPTTTCLGSKDSTTELRPPRENERPNPTPASALSQGNGSRAAQFLYSATANFRRPTRRWSLVPTANGITALASVNFCSSTSTPP